MALLKSVCLNPLVGPSHSLMLAVEAETAPRWQHKSTRVKGISPWPGFSEAAAAAAAPFTRLCAVHPFIDHRRVSALAFVAACAGTTREKGSFLFVATSI